MLGVSTAKATRWDVSYFAKLLTTLVYVRFDANDLHMKAHFPINSSESRFGPGTYGVDNFHESQKTYGANTAKGTFLSGKRDVHDLKNPGPCHY